MQDIALDIETPIKPIPPWIRVQLGSIVRFTKKPKNLHYTEYPHIPFIPMESIPIGQVFFDRFELRSNEEISSGTYFESGDILLAKITPSFENGKQGIIQELPTKFGIATTEVIPFNEVDGVSNKYFLFYSLLRNSIRTELASKMEGSTGRQRLSIFALMNLEIALPPLPEQRAIAHILQTAQNATQSRRKELALERERKAALMQHLFTRGARGEATKQTEIGEMPVSWRSLKLGDVITLQRGFDLPTSQRTPGKIPVVSSSGISGTHDSAKVIGPGVITGRYGTIGQVFYVDTNFWPLNTTLFVNDFKGNNPKFISYFLQSIDLQVLNDKTSVPGINRNHVHAIPVSLPQVEEQQEIATTLQACDSKIAALEKEIRLQEELFRALLEELMTGRLSSLPLVEDERN